MEFREITHLVEKPRFLDVLALSVGYPTPEKLAAVVARYRHPTWSAYALFDAATVVGVCGLESLPAKSGRLRHIAVRPESQRSGVGRLLIEELRARRALREIQAETHAGAAPIYERCGFTVVSLGERYPGVERFAVQWRAA